MTAVGFVPWAVTDRLSSPDDKEQGDEPMEGKELVQDADDGREGLRVMSIYLDDEPGQPDVVVMLDKRGEVRACGVSSPPVADDRNAVHTGISV